MALPKREKRPTADATFTVRCSRWAADKFRIMAKQNGLTQGEAFDALVKAEWCDQLQKSKKK